MEQERSSKEIEQAIQKLDTIIRKLKPVFEEVEKGGFNPFIEITYEEVKALKEELEVMLEEYQYYRTEFEEGNIFINLGDHAVQVDPTSFVRGENAPAYKGDLDAYAMYQMWKKDVPINEIARRFQCAPGTVKSRVLKIQQRKKWSE